MSISNLGRRRFLVSAIYGLWGLMGAALAVPAALFLFLPPRLKRRGNWVDLGDLTKFKNNKPEEVVFRQGRLDGWNVISQEASAWVVVRAPDNFAVFAPQCTHLGCAYHWDERKHRFYCPCHSSAFGIDGQVLAGPAARPLDRYEARLMGTHLEVWPGQPHA